MKKHKGLLAIIALLLALLMAITFLPVMTGWIIQRQMNQKPMVTATPEPVYENFEGEGM